MKNVGYVLPCFPVLSETFVGTEMRAMRRVGHRIQPFAFRRGQGLSQPIDAELARRTLYLDELSTCDALRGLGRASASTLQGLRFALKQKGIRPRSLIWQAGKLACAARRTGCDHLHAHFAQAATATAIVAARLLGVSISFVGHGHDVYSTPSDLPLKLQAANFSVAVCEDMEKDFAAIDSFATIARVYCGIETDRFKPVDAVVCDQVRFLFVGRFVEAKGLTDLIAALRKIPLEIRPIVDLIGEGELMPLVKQQVMEWELDTHVNFLGAKSSEWIAEHAPRYSALVAPFCLAANGERDTGPVVVKEAMAMGLPVITTHFMGCKEMVTDDTGLRVPPKDIAALARAITRVVRMSDGERKVMGRAGRARVLELYTADRQACVLSEFVEAA